jgi:hypothetical protein
MNEVIKGLIDVILIIGAWELIKYLTRLFPEVIEEWKRNKKLKELKK